jgi:hypothetical protein
VQNYEKLSAEQNKLVCFLFRDAEFELARLASPRISLSVMAMFLQKQATKASSDEKSSEEQNKLVCFYSDCE